MMSPSVATAAQRATEADRHRQPGGYALRGDHLVQVQQAKIVLAALAHDDELAPLGGVGQQAGELALHLALEMAREGGDPDRPLVPLGPEAGRPM
jgi:hypothetical protein